MHQEMIKIDECQQMYGLLGTTRVRWGCVEERPKRKTGGNRRSTPRWRRPPDLTTFLDRNYKRYQCRLTYFLITTAHHAVKAYARNTASHSASYEVLKAQMSSMAGCAKVNADKVLTSRGNRYKLITQWHSPARSESSRRRLPASGRDARNYFRDLDCTARGSHGRHPDFWQTDAH